MALTRTHFTTPLSFSPFCHSRGSGPFDDTQGRAEQSRMRGNQGKLQRESGFSVKLRMTQTRGFELVTSFKLFSFKKGVSLTELLVAIGIAGGISLGIISIYTAHYRIFTNQNALIEAETQNKLAMAEITKYAKEALQFSSESQFNDNLPSTTLGFRLLPLDANGNPYNAGLYDNAMIKRDPASSSKLIEYGKTSPPVPSTTRDLMKRGYGPGLLPPKIIATGVTDFQILYYDPVPQTLNGYVNSKRAEIFLKTESKTIYGKTFTSTQTATIYIRN